MSGLRKVLDLSNLVLAAPMAGGASTPAYVVGAARACSLGFLAGGYKTSDALANQLRVVRESTDLFGVNLFVPTPVPITREVFRRYAARLQSDAARYDLALPADEPISDDDYWSAKLDLLLTDPVPVVSFTFGVPAAVTIRALRQRGTLTVQTVTSPAEAEQAVAAGVEVLAVQSPAAGGHYGTFTPGAAVASWELTELVAAVRASTTVPIVGAGGVSTAAGVAAVLQAGADAVMVGTVLLRSVESGASATHQAALADTGRGDTVVTRAFTGRPARALPNQFIADHDAQAPSGYPAIHHLTSDLRKAAAAAGDADRVHLWAGTGYRDATAEPVEIILRRLAESG